MDTTPRSSPRNHAEDGTNGFDSDEYSNDFEDDFDDEDARQKHRQSPRKGSHENIPAKPMDVIPIKYKLGESLRRSNLQKPLKLAQLYSQVKSSFQLHDAHAPKILKFSYFDDENDRVTVTTDEELKAALDCAKESNRLLQLDLTIEENNSTGDNLRKEARTKKIGRHRERSNSLNVRGSGKRVERQRKRSGSVNIDSTSKKAATVKSVPLIGVKPARPYHSRQQHIFEPDTRVYVSATGACGRVVKFDQLKGKYLVILTQQPQGQKQSRFRAATFWPFQIVRAGTQFPTPDRRHRRRMPSFGRNKTHCKGDKIHKLRCGLLFTAALMFFSGYTHVSQPVVMSMIMISVLLLSLLRRYRYQCNNHFTSLAQFRQCINKRDLKDWLSTSLARLEVSRAFDNLVFLQLLSVGIALIFNCNILANFAWTSSLVALVVKFVRACLAPSHILNGDANNTAPAPGNTCGAKSKPCPTFAEIQYHQYIGKARVVLVNTAKACETALTRVAVSQVFAKRRDIASRRRASAVPFLGLLVIGSTFFFIINYPTIIFWTLHFSAVGMTVAQQQAQGRPQKRSVTTTKPCSAVPRSKTNANSKEASQAALLKSALDAISHAPLVYRNLLNTQLDAAMQLYGTRLCRKKLEEVRQVAKDFTKAARQNHGLMATKGGPNLEASASVTSKGGTSGTDELLRYVVDAIIQAPATHQQALAVRLDQALQSNNVKALRNLLADAESYA